MGKNNIKKLYFKWKCRNRWRKFNYARGCNKYRNKSGKHCIINVIFNDHHNYFKDYSSCGPGVITGGKVTIGENSHLGIGAVVKNGIMIENNTIIGGNSYVNKNCNNSSIYFGNPLKLVKKKRAIITFNHPYHHC